MKFANEYPLFRLLVPMLMGILSAHFFQDYYIPVLISVVLFVLLLFWVFRPSVLRIYSWRFLSGIIISILFFILGFELLWVKTNLHQSNHYSKFDSISHLVVEINTPLIEREKTFKTVVKVNSVYLNNDSIAKKAIGKIILYFDKECSPVLKYGDELLIANNLQEIKGFGNPHEFDYAKYLKQQNIYHQIYLIRTDWIKTHHQSPNIIIQLSLYIRDALLNILRDFEFTEPEFAVASAILLGYDDYLDQDIRKLYAGSGAMHILCVSGLHVGIIFLIFNTLLGFLKRFKNGSYMHAIIIIIIIWIYALVTGLSPSVFRSATMFSFITIGGIMNRKTSTYNSLAASAFVLLIVNPYLLFHIGFQLSYLAVFSILFIQPHLSSLFRTKWWFANKVTDLLAVSIAAQLGTFPLAIYYFHQFPNLFIITNLLVIPLSFIILIGGFANIFIYLIGSGTSYLGFLITKGLYYSLWFLNYSLESITDIPHAVSYHLYFTISDTILVYLIILLISLYFIHKKVNYLLFVIFSFVTLFGINSWHRYTKGSQNQLIIYNAPKHSLIDIIYKNNSTLFADSVLKENDDKIQRYIADNHLNRRVKSENIFSFNDIEAIQNKSFSSSKNLLIIQGKSIFIIDEKVLLPDTPMKYHYVLLRDNPKLSVYDMTSFCSFDTLIIDASNKYWNIRQWKKQCDSLNIPMWNIKEDGAFILKNNVTIE